MPSAEQAATLHERVAAVMRVLEAADKEAGGPRPVASDRLIEKHRPRLDEAMTALGVAVADFFDTSDEPVNLEALRSDFLEPILAISRTLPVFRRILAWAANREEATELQEFVLEGRAAGFDGQSMLLGDYYQQRIVFASMRSRVAEIMRMMREEFAARGAFEGRPIRVLVLGANGIAGLDSALTRRRLPEPVRRVSLFVFIVDPVAYALRRVRQSIDQAFSTRSQVLLTSPASLPRHPNRPTEPFDIIYTLSQYDMLPAEDGLAFTKSILPFLKPGGVLLTGAFLPVIPPGHRALAFALTGLRWASWDEAAWRGMLAELPFDLAASRFEAHPPATLAVLARRRQAEGE